MQPSLAILSLLLGAMGWYYLFYSRAADKLGSIEEQKSNKLRGFLRRINAIVMLLMALGIAFGTYKFAQRGTETEFVVTWSAVMLLLIICLILGLIDLRLTMKLRDQLRERNK